MKRLTWVSCACALVLAACATTPPAELPPAPEARSGWTPQPGWHFAHEAVAAAHPLAAQAGAEMLAAGGSALDAAIAAQLVLTLVEPQSSGIGGGAMLMLWDGQHLQAWDGRETAPAADDERLFLHADGSPLKFDEAVEGGRAVGTPGVLRMLAQAHQREGRLPWARLFEPAIRWAEQGFAVSPRLHSLLLEDRTLMHDPQARAYFFDAQDQVWPIGHMLRNPALAAIYRRLAAEGVEAFYQGPIARDMVARVRGHGVNPGGLSEDDLRDYQPRVREALCTDWREVWRVCGFPPPSSGHLTMMQILGMLPVSDAAHAIVLGQPGPDWLHGYTEASRLAFADRDRYIADPDFVSAPGGDWQTLLAPAYLAQRAALIGPRSMGRASAGDPVPGASLSLASQPEQVEHGTSHVSVVDARGHSVSMTTTVESAFGARLMSDGGTGLPGGFMLNNQLTDFSFVPRDAQGHPVANRVEPGKRPRSSMSPTLVFDRKDGRLLMSVGSPGGAAIIHYVAKMLVATEDWGLNVQDAANLANFGSFNGPTALEKGMFPAATQEALRARGHQVVETDLVSGVAALERQGNGWFGAADPRREGSVKGD